MKLIVGLGNPGAKYSGTRHNIGFEVIDYLASAPAVGPFKSSFQALVAETSEGGEKILLVKPETFMNLSGRAVRAIVDFYKLTTADVLVVCDDFNLPLGKLRIRATGSAGGQNGLKSIQETLGTDAYLRMRIGVGQPGPNEAVDFVLSRFKPGERATVDEAIAAAANAAMIWIRRGAEACMNAANGPSEPPKKKSPPLSQEERDRRRDAKKKKDPEPETRNPEPDTQ